MKAGKAFTYRAFDCHQMSLAEEIEIVPTPVVIIEGAYTLPSGICTGVGSYDFC